MACNYYSWILGMSVAILVQCSIGSIYRLLKTKSLREFSIAFGSICLLAGCGTYSYGLLFRSVLATNSLVFISTCLYIGYFLTSTAGIIRYVRQVSEEKKFLAMATLFSVSLLMPMIDWVSSLKAIVRESNLRTIPSSFGFINVISVCQLCIGIAQVYSKVANAPELTETIVGRNVITMLVATFWQIQYGVFYVYLNDNLYYLPVVFLMLSVILLLETSAGSVLQKINKYERSHNQAIVASALDKPRSSEQQN